ncbi:hypothetical protein [Acetobacterium wieringae]|uniref:hypothetical protein n=1 Tax=Acetobacterium wieringae TaxID=52694 RepID=UPI0026F0A693|nr:hypothetical protein [Acetobacterium wieringae]
MKIVSSKKCISEIRKQIEIQKNNVLHDEINRYDAFEIVYQMMHLSKALGILNKKTLDALWREAQEITA